ncbi:unnamed protein product [Paramecium sonneborni]|uniref:Uncharacterized protein n=1 Tax=Paramecium sonneborni TaxID=65129 RepID=A0A8S1N7Z8_9CILI|nr:unnamed protein product [Paramecium sonneborni]
MDKRSSNHQNQKIGQDIKFIKCDYKFGSSTNNKVFKILLQIKSKSLNSQSLKHCGILNSKFNQEIIIFGSKKMIN